MDTSPTPMYSTVLWLTYTVVGLSISVILGTITGVAVSSSTLTLSNFTANGQFAVYTAGMVVSTYYLVHKPAAFRLPYTEWFGIVSLVALTFTLAFIAVATLVAAKYQVNGKPINQDLYQVPSIILFAVSLAVAFYAVLLDNRRSHPDFMTARAESEEELAEKIEKKRRGGQP